MAIRRCRLIALEGTHGTGKTTLALALVARLKQAHLNACYMGETARDSPFLEGVVVHGKGSMDISAELHIFATQIAREQLLARYHRVLVCDKSVVNVVAYANLLMGRSDHASRLLASMVGLCRAYVPLYDAAFLLSDRHQLGLTEDPFRPGDGALRDAVEAELVRICTEVGMALQPVPRGVPLERQVDWVVDRLQAAGVVPPSAAGGGDGR